MLAHVKALESPDFLAGKAGVSARLGAFPRARMNSIGGGRGGGHPFGATDDRTFSQAVKALSARPMGERPIVSIRADGGLRTVTLLQAGGAPEPFGASHAKEQQR